MARQIERYETNLRATVLWFNADDVHVIGRSGAEFGVTMVVIVYAKLALALLVATGKALRGAGRLADGLIADALEHLSEAGHVLPVEGLDSRGCVGSLEGSGFDAQVEVAEVEIDVSGIVVFAVVVFDRHGAWISGQPDGRDIGVFIGLDVHGAEGSAHSDVISVAVIAVRDLAAGEEQARSGQE
jgi:hypothetical protein